MGLFGSKSTINDKKWADIQRRARVEEARRGGMLSRQATERRKATERQRKRSSWS